MVCCLGSPRTFSFFLSPRWYKFLLNCYVAQETVPCPGLFTPVMPSGTLPAWVGIIRRWEVDVSIISLVTYILLP